MYPAAIALPDELGKLNLPLLSHLLYEFEQPTVVGPVACDDVHSTADEVVTVLHTSDERVEFLASVARGHHYRLTPRVWGLITALLTHVIGGRRTSMSDCQCHRAAPWRWQSVLEY